MRTSRSILFVVLLLGLAMIQWGCDHEAGPEAVVTDGPAEKIDGERYLLDFGSVAIGASRELAFQLRNDGSSALELSDVGVSGQYGSAFRVALEPEPVLPGDVLELEVVFEPVDVGLVKGVLYFSTNDRELPRMTVELFGEGYDPKLDITPGSLDFGEVAPGEKVHRTVTFRNRGNAPVEVESIAVEARFGGADYLGFSTEPLTFPIRLEEQEEKELEVTFEPEVPGPHQTAVLRWTSSDPEAPEGSVDLWGYAIDMLVRVQPESLDFGGVGTDCPLRTREFCIWNEGTEKLIVEEVWISGSGEEAYELPSPPEGKEIAEGEQLCVQVDFMPRAAGEREAEVHVSVSGISELFVVPMRGEGLDEDAPWPSEGSGCLQGRVCSPAGSWLPGAMVTMTLDGSEGEETLRSRSDGQGYFYIEGVPVGTWDLSVETRSFSTEVEVEILDDRLTILDEPVCVDPDSARIVVLYGSGGNMEHTLERIGATNVKVFSTEFDDIFDLLSDIEKLSGYDMLLFNSRGVTFSGQPEVQETVRAFVEGGGSLGANRDAGSLIESVWPELFERLSDVVECETFMGEDGYRYLRGAVPVDPLLAEYVGKSDLDLRAYGLCSFGFLTSEDERFKSVIEIDGVVLEDGTRDGVSYMSYFDYGAGRIGFSSQSPQEFLLGEGDGGRAAEFFLLGL